MITRKTLGDALELTIEVDSLDASNATELKDQFKHMDMEGVSRVILNMSKVDFIDSSGIGALLSFYKQMNRRVTLSQATPTVLSVLELLRLHRVFEFEPVA